MWDKIEIMVKNIIRDKEGLFIMIKGWITHEAVRTLICF